MNPELERAIAVVGDLPSIPSIANEVMAMASDPGSSAEDICRILERDPALSARILKVANSSLYSFSREVETLQHAVTLLGFRSVSSMVLAASLRDVFQNFGLAEKLLWEHSTLAGAVAARLCSYGAIDMPREPAFTACLLHDLGKIALCNMRREEYQSVIVRTYNEGISYVDAEREAFGFDHAELGGLVAEKWKLSPRLVLAIRCHHQDPSEYAHRAEEDRRLIALTSVVTRCCTRLGVGRRAPVDAVRVTDLPAWWALGLSADDRDPVLSLVSQEAKAAEGLFG